MTRAGTFRARPNGASLVEVLVALLVVAAGALGLVGLQIVSAQNNRAALQRSLATLLAGDMLERIRANPDAHPRAVGKGPPGAFADCLARACSPAEVATLDIAVWKCSLGNWNDEGVCATARAQGLTPPLERHPGLPAGDGAVAQRDGLATVTVSWQGVRPGEVVMRGRM